MNRYGKVGILSLLAVSLIAAAGVVSGAEEAAAKPSTTLDNLQAAYKSASAAKAGFEAFAAKAAEEGYFSVAALFKAGALSEGIHAKKCAAAIEKLGAAVVAPEFKPPAVKSTKENLEAALKGEIAANQAALPAFAKLAETEKNIPAMYAFKGALAAEAEFVKMARAALAGIEDWKAAGKEFLVCDVCGYPTMDKALVKCPVCAAPRSKFTEVK